ncbi:hypothetical protein APA91_34165 [Pseudomonas aeruginosa]|nr:hypothetical protein APA28_30785 [Pseudomonas aeruginosa]OPE06412.1 hypothetical protein APA42_29500 [Pseudomonas aeruginosa]OPE23925.1 hypothetical protein APA91_34165 [Pseudomonas aeruginosa]OPE31127.1 hypothetical protein APB28_37205 [Pseudomonas aeruginosa]OWH95249.1 hypothetical protein CDC13_27780 [Pseudomonas aeruginosa]
MLREIAGVVVDRTHSFVTAFLISAGIALIAAAVYALVVRKRVDSSDNERTPEVSTTTPQNS